MNYIYSIILGIIQGLTEFLPISSSGHLFIAHQWLGFDLADNLSFDVALHCGTLLALVVFFYRDIIRLVKALFASLCRPCLKTDPDQKLVWLLIIGTIPAAIAGYFGEAWLEKTFHHTWSVATMLILVGVLMLIVEKYARRRADLHAVNLKQTLVIGCTQALALIPGVSRSGITIIAGMGQGLKREAAARFSFLLAIPIVTGAAAKKIFDLIQTNPTAAQIDIYLLGALAAALSGWLAVKLLLKFLARYPLNVFAYYRFVLGLILLLTLFI